MQDDEVSNEEFDSFEEEQRQRRCKIIAVAVVVVAIVVVVICYCCMGGKKEGESAAVAGEGWGESILGQYFDSDDVNDTNITNDTCREGTNLFADLDVVNHWKQHTAWEGMPASNWGDSFTKGKYILNAAERFINDQSDLAEMGFVSFRQKPQNKHRVLQVLKLMIQACPDWMELPDWVNSMVYVTGASSAQPSMYWDRSLSMDMTMAKVNAKSGLSHKDKNKSGVDHNTARARNEEGSAARNPGAWVVGNRATLRVNYAMFNDFCQQDDMTAVSYTGVADVKDQQFITYVNGIPTVQKAATQKSQVEAEERLSNAVNGTGTVPCLCEDKTIGYLDIQDRIDAMDSTMEYLALVAEGYDDEKVSIARGTSDEEVVDVLLSMKTITQRRSRLLYIARSCPKYSQMKRRVKNAASTLTHLGMFKFNAQNRMMTVGQARAGEIDNKQSIIGNTMMHEGVFAANAGHMINVYSRVFNWSQRHRARAMGNMENGVLKMLKPSSFLEGKDMVPVNRIGGIDSMRLYAGRGSITKVFDGLQQAGEDDYEFDPYNRLQPWSRPDSWRNWNSLWGLTTMVDATNAVCQLKYYEENVKLLATKFNQLTQGNGSGIMAALKGDDEELRPYLLMSGRGLSQSNGRDAEAAAKLGFSDRAAMFERLSGIDAESLNANAEFFANLYKFIQHGDISKIVNDNVMALVDNMQVLTEDHALYGRSAMFSFGWEYARSQQKAEITGAATINVMAKYFRKIKTVIYIIDKFVRYDDSIKTKKAILDSLKAEALQELKQETWQDSLHKQVGSLQLGGDGLGGVQMVSQPAPAAQKAQRLFGRLTSIAGDLYEARSQDMFQQAGQATNALKSMLQSGGVKAGKMRG